MKKWVFTVLPILLSISWCFSQQAQIKLYTTADGLSSNRIWNITQDNHGFLWISTDGLNRFDGRQFLNHTNDQGQVFEKNDQARTIHCIQDKLYYLEDKFLVAYHIASGKKRSYTIDSSKAINNAHINYGQLIKTHDETLIIPVIYLKENKVDLFQYKLNSIKRLATLSDAFIDPEILRIHTCINEEADRYFYYLNSSKDSVITLNAAGVKVNSTPIPEKGLASLWPSHQGKIYLSQNKKLYDLNPSKNTFKLHPINSHFSNLNQLSISSFKETQDGNLWLCGGDRNLLYYEVREDRIYDYTKLVKTAIPFNLELGKIYIEQNNLLWIRTMMGLLKVQPKKKWFETSFTEQHEACRGWCSFRGFAEDEKGIIYSSFYSNLLKFKDSEKHKQLRPLAPHGYSPFDLFYDDGKLILNNGHVYDPLTNKVSNPFQIQLESYDHGIFASDNNNRIWFGFKSNVYQLNKHSSDPKWEIIIEESDRRHKGFLDLKWDNSQNKLWYTSLNEFGTINTSTNQYEPIQLQEFPDNIVIRYIHPDNDGKIWLATESGLGLYDSSNDYLKLYTIDNGLSNNNITTILPEGDSCLWLGTHHGLSRFNKFKETFINFYEEDGLAHNEFNRRSAFISKQGKYYFGGIRGITIFSPESVMRQYRAAQQSSQLSLTAFTKTDINQNSTSTQYLFSQTPSVEIFHQNRTFEFEYTLTDYQDLDKVKYAYQLEGYDEVWSKPSNRNQASFNSLPSGNYTFRVKALNQRGEWLPKQLAVDIIVYPPWWKSWWAYALYALMLTSIILGIYYFLKRRWELKALLKEEYEEAKRLKELDSFKSRLYTNLTHEFRTPLTVILGMAQQIQDSPNQGTEQASGIIKRNGQNLLRLVNQLLDLSKLEDKSFKLNLKYSNVVPFLHYITESFQSYANSQNLSLTFFSPLKTLEMDFDPEQITQVISNLISNAIKFTPSGGEIRVEISQQRDQLMVSVSDTGVGIPANDLPHIFDRFYQVDGSTTRAGEGTGIGLAHASELVKLMNGKISVESTINQGSTFLVQLPIHHKLKGQKVERLEFDEEWNAVAEKGNGLETALLSNGITNSLATQSNKQQLLIIEDNTDVVFYLKSCLQDQYDLDIAYNGRIGIEKALSSIPDLIISDVMMPEKDGYEVCEALKNDERTSHIPIILLTAKADVSSKIAGLRRGADAYLAKPFNKEELLVRLEKLAELRKRLQERYSLLSQGHVQNKSVIDPNNLEDLFVQKIQNIVAENFDDENFALPQLCKKAGLSRSQLFRKMKALMAVSPSEYIRSYRMQEAKKLLESKKWTVSEVAWKVGFKHLSHFSKSYQETFGHPPTQPINK